jgi:hypothetical protein
MPTKESSKLLAISRDWTKNKSYKKFSRDNNFPDGRASLSTKENFASFR